LPIIPGLEEPTASIQPQNNAYDSSNSSSSSSDSVCISSHDFPSSFASYSLAIERSHQVINNIELIVVFVLCIYLEMFLLSHVKLESSVVLENSLAVDTNITVSNQYSLFTSYSLILCSRISRNALRFTRLSVRHYESLHWPDLEVQY
jgi:hypothetical protein